MQPDGKRVTRNEFRKTDVIAGVSVLGAATISPPEGKKRHKLDFIRLRPIGTIAPLAVERLTKNGLEACHRPVPRETLHIIMALAG
jgi:hypothetical protein